VEAATANCPVAAFSNAAPGLYAVQFHPEVNHTVEGRKILKNFVLDICGCAGDYRAEDQIEEMLGRIRNQVGEGKVVAGLSGGVDSSVACVLADRALKKGQLSCVFVDHGLLRKDEAKQVMETYREHLGLDIRHVDASERFLAALKGVTDPEVKRKTIGELFVRVFEEEAKKTGATFLLQGTIYPERIESGMGAPPPSRATTTWAACPRTRCSRRAPSWSRWIRSSRTRCAP
jgi:GMP synthase (glutamine-hydrolysing)